MEKIKVLVSIWLTALGLSLSGCFKESDGAITEQQTSGIISVENEDKNNSAGKLNSDTWSQNPEWISRNYDLQGRPKLLHRVYYDYFRFRRQKAERELAAKQATDSMLYQYAHQHAAENASDTVVEVQRTFTGYKPDSTSDTL